MSEDDVCSVCWDTFKLPKLLPCKHTFCIPCLYEYLDELNDKSNMVCPLCREPCFVPDKGFEDFPTNYFVEAKKTSKNCQECEKAKVTKVCKRCNLCLCVKCDVLHTHTKPSIDNDDDQDIVTSTGLPFLRRHPDTKTELTCEQTMIFVPEFPSTLNERKSIRSLAFSRGGGVYVNQPNSKHLLKCNKRGQIIAEIPVVEVGDVSGVLETRSGDLLIAHFLIKSVVCYGDGNPNYKRYHFAKTPSFHPIGLSELSNGNIVIGGPTHLCNSKCTEKNKECEMEPKTYGIIHIVSETGDRIKEIIKNGEEYIHKFPIYIASSSFKFGTFAVCDSQKVIIYDNNGDVRSTFTGSGLLPFLFVPQNLSFLSTAVCATSDGNFVISDPRQECLQVLNPYGRFIGVLRCENGDLTHTNALCVDSENNIWVGHKLQGTVTVLKTKCFKNVFEKSVLPTLPFLGNDLGLPGLGNIDPNLWMQFLTAEISDN